jgi:hypothetical protein
MLVSKAFPSLVPRLPPVSYIEQAVVDLVPSVIQPTPADPLTVGYTERAELSEARYLLTPMLRLLLHLRRI